MKIELNFTRTSSGWYHTSFKTDGYCMLQLNTEREGKVVAGVSDGTGQPAETLYNTETKDRSIAFDYPAEVVITVTSEAPVVYAAVSGANVTSV